MDIALKVCYDSNNSYFISGVITMEVVRDEMSVISDFISTIEKNSQFVRAENGLSKIIVV